MYLVRKINPAKWEEKRLVAQGLRPGAVSADAVTADLRTQGNTLSFWRVCSDRREDIEQAMLALACAYQRLDRLVVVWVDGEQLRCDGLEVEPSPGRTALREWKDRHVDVVKLDYEGLGAVARHIQRAMRGDRCLAWRKREVRKRLQEAVERGFIDTDALDDKLRGALGIAAG